MHRQLSGLTEGLPPENKAVCRKCNSKRIKVVALETEDKKFAVCEDCGDIQSIGSSLHDRYSKWKSNRESPRR